MTTTALAFVAAITLGFSTSASQKPEGGGIPPSGKGDTVVVRGCVSGSLLKDLRAQKTEPLTGSETAVVYRLTGEKKLLQVDPERAPGPGARRERCARVESDQPQHRAQQDDGQDPRVRRRRRAGDIRAGETAVVPDSQSDVLRSRPAGLRTMKETSARVDAPQVLIRSHRMRWTGDRRPVTARVG